VIEARGPHIRTWLNGVLCTDLLDTADLEGFIALQVHAAKEGALRWRHIRINVLGRVAGRRSSWRWARGLAKAGALASGPSRMARSAARRRAGVASGYLVSKDSFGDFALRLDYQAAKGSGGLDFRAQTPRPA